MTKAELITKAIDFLRDNPEVFVDSINELDCYSGFAGEYRVEPMDFLDDYFSGQRASEILDHVDGNFSTSDDYFYFDDYGDICSTNDAADYYERHFDYGEVVDALIDDYSRIDIYSSELDEIIEALYNEDFDDDDELPYGPGPVAGGLQWIDEQ